MALEPETRDEGLVTADDHHDEQVRDHHDVDQAEHHQHDLLFGKADRVSDEVPQFLEEEDHVNRLGRNQPDVKRQLKPARTEDNEGQRAQRAWIRRYHFGENLKDGG